MSILHPVTLLLLLTPVELQPQTVKSDSCQTAQLKAPTKWVGVSQGSAELRTGPGTNYPIHVSEELVPGERIQVLQECRGWLQARVLQVRMIDAVIREHGLARAQEMLLFWVRKDQIRKAST